jgi:hypothetical protein
MPCTTGWTTSTRRSRIPTRCFRMDRAVSEVRVLWYEHLSGNRRFICIQCVKSLEVQGPNSDWDVRLLVAIVQRSGCVAPSYTCATGANTLASSTRGKSTVISVPVVHVITRLLVTRSIRVLILYLRTSPFSTRRDIAGLISPPASPTTHQSHYPAHPTSPGRGQSKP